MSCRRDPLRIEERRLDDLYAVRHPLPLEARPQKVTHDGVIHRSHGQAFVNRGHRRRVVTTARADVEQAPGVAEVETPHHRFHLVEVQVLRGAHQHVGRPPQVLRDRIGDGHRRIAPPAERRGKLRPHGVPELPPCLEGGEHELRRIEARVEPDTSVIDDDETELRDHIEQRPQEVGIGVGPLRKLDWGRRSVLQQGRNEPMLHRQLEDVVFRPRQRALVIGPDRAPPPG